VLESLDSADQSLWKLTKRVTRVPSPLPHLLLPVGLALSDSEKGEALAVSLEALFQSVNDPSSPAVFEAVDEGDVCMQVCSRKCTKIYLRL
jgi:hypothetical protein